MTAFEERDMNWSNLSLSTPIYGDYRLKNGFTNLFLTTGEAKQKFSGVAFLKGIVGKRFPGLVV